MSERSPISGGQSQAEIAHTLDAPVGTVKSWISRGLESLRAMPMRDMCLMRHSTVSSTDPLAVLRNHG
jgi:hypothetical protein